MGQLLIGAVGAAEAASAAVAQDVEAQLVVSTLHPVSTVFILMMFYFTARLHSALQLIFIDADKCIDYFSNSSIIIFFFDVGFTQLAYTFFFNCL